MDEPLIHIRYDGGDADHHAIDMRLLGESLIGLDRIVSDGLIIVTERRLPKRGERSSLILKANEPKKGSVDIWGDLQEKAGLLQFGVPIIQQIGATFIWTWVKSVVNFHAGRKDVAERCMEAITQINRDHLGARDQADERRHIEQVATIGLLRDCLPRLGPATAQASSPVGPSVRALEFSTRSSEPVVVDQEMADAIRARSEVEWGDPEEMVLKTDGFTFHTKKMSVEHPHRTGYLLAEVEDPVFNQDGNPYAVAASEKATVRVLAKSGFRGDSLEKIAVLHFYGVVEA